MPATPAPFEVHDPRDPLNRSLTMHEDLEVAHARGVLVNGGAPIDAAPPPVEASPLSHFDSAAPPQAQASPALSHFDSAAPPPTPGADTAAEKKPTVGEGGLKIHDKVTHQKNRLKCKGENLDFYHRLHSKNATFCSDFGHSQGQDPPWIKHINL